MRQIHKKAIVVFTSLTLINIFFNAALCYFLFQIGGFAKQAMYFIAPFSFYLTNIFTYRVLFYFLNFPTHDIPKNTSKDFAFQLYVLYLLIFFNFFIHNPLLPLPISKLFYQMLGTKFGSGSYSVGIILDPAHVEIGENSIVGFDAVLCSHALEGENVSFEKIIIGSNVTIGLRSMIMPGVIIEDHSIVAAGALIPKNTHIKKGEVWAGIPAKKIKQSQEEVKPLIVDFEPIKKLA